MQKPIDISGITSIKTDSLFQIILSNPRKYNALTMAMYEHMGNLLSYANSEPEIKLIYITGEGDFYSSGADLSQYSSMESFAVHNLEGSRDKIIKYVDSYIDCDKPIFVAVNGPAIGISFSLLALCDIVYCTEETYFSAPFINLALAPEACSSYLFPKIFGHSLGREAVLFGRKINAKEAEKSGFVTEVLKKEGFKEFTLKKAIEYSKFDRENLVNFKKLMRGNEKDILKKVNRNEINFLFTQWQRGEFLEKMKKVIELNKSKINKKSKL